MGFRGTWMRTCRAACAARDVAMRAAARYGACAARDVAGRAAACFEACGISGATARWAGSTALATGIHVMAVESANFEGRSRPLRGWSYFHG
jgi:hypothetical protein